MTMKKLAALLPIAGSLCMTCLPSCKFPEPHQKWVATGKVRVDSECHHENISYEFKVMPLRITGKQQATADFTAKRIDHFCQRDAQFHQSQLVDVQPPAPMALKRLWDELAAEDSSGHNIFSVVLAIPLCLAAEPIILMANLAMSGDARTDSYDWGTPRYDFEGAKIKRWTETDVMPIEVNGKTRLIQWEVSNGQITVRTASSLGTFDKQVATKQYHDALMASCSRILQDPAPLARELSKGNHTSVDKSLLTVTAARGEDPHCDRVTGHLQNPPVRQLEVLSYYPDPIPTTEQIIHAALDTKVRDTMRSFGERRQGGKVVAPKPSELTDVIAAAITPSFRAQALRLYQADAEQVEQLAKATVARALKAGITEAIVDHKIKVMDIDSRAPIAKAKVKVRVTTTVWEDLVKREIAPQSQAFALNVFKELITRMKTGQSGQCDDEGCLTFAAPRDATVEVEVVSKDHHFIKHKFVDLVLQQRPSDQSLFLPADTIGLFVSNTQKPRRQQVVK